MNIVGFMSFWTLRFWPKWRCRAWKMTCTNLEWCENLCNTTSPTRTNQNYLIPHSVAPTSLQSRIPKLIDIHIHCECLAMNMRLNRTMNETDTLECFFRAEINYFVGKSMRKPLWYVWTAFYRSKSWFFILLSMALYPRTGIFEWSKSTWILTIWGQNVTIL